MNGTLPSHLPRPLTLATCAYPIDFLEDWAQYEAKQRALVREAADAGADLLVFPEYGAMELTSLLPARLHADLPAQITALAPLLERAHALTEALARLHGVHILAASAPTRLSDDSAVNRACLFSPAGIIGHQDKLIMTRWERDPWGVRGKGPAHVFDTALGRIGICICYDAEFPLIARAMAQAGAELLLVPSATDSLAGYWRVRIGAQARALENQCFVAHAVAVGAAPWSQAVDINIGASGVYAPPDIGFPDDGVLALGGLNRPGWTYARLDLAAVQSARSDGGVLPFAHWPEQARLLGERVKIIAAPGRSDPPADP
ncbi:MAG: carbon-nitrogen hydrolase family protein [Neomegalonema sp.]|nr:carbon-nitrogen hydrolase family protein [Neomegalonema sp.]